MPNILLLATAWGPKHGGINAFNMDFAVALAGYLRPTDAFSARFSTPHEKTASAQKL